MTECYLKQLQRAHEQIALLKHEEYEKNEYYNNQITKMNEQITNLKRENEEFEMLAKTWENFAEEGVKLWKM